MSNMIPAYIFRLRARQAMKPVMSILVLVLLIAMLPDLVSNTITLISGSDPSTVIAQLYTEENINAMLGPDLEASAAASETILNGMKAFFLEKWPFMALTTAISLIFTPVLTLGLNHTLLKTLRREEISAGTVLARLPLFFRAIGLRLMTILRIFLWMLPGWGVSMLGAVALVFVPAVGILLMFAAMILMMVLMLRAMYSYRLAPYVMADAPDTGINAAIRRSCTVMNGRRMELFSLEFSFVGWRLLLSMGQVMLLSLFGSVVGMTLGMFVSFFLQMYVNMAEAAFYQEYAVGPLPAQAAAESDSRF